MTSRDRGTHDGASAADALEPLLALELEDWTGLPPLPVAALEAALGPPEQTEETHLGSHPARRLTFRTDRPSGGLLIYVRDDRAVLAETIAAPPDTLLASLGPPGAIKAHEILVPGAYVREYVYPDRGLVLSVAEPFAAPEDKRVVRGRGVRRLVDADELGPEFYLQFENRTSFSGG